MSIGRRPRWRVSSLFNNVQADLSQEWPALPLVFARGLKPALGLPLRDPRDTGGLGPSKAAKVRYSRVA